MDLITQHRKTKEQLHYSPIAESTIVLPELKGAGERMVGGQILGIKMR